MDKMKMESVDITAQNIEKIGALFPNCITETADKNGKLKKAINFDMLKQMLSDEVAEGDESYEFTWVGKKKAIVEANKPIRKTLRPCPEESVNWDTTENLYIEGDNLEVLKLLQESYLGKVKMIYIDPPYNTGNDFIYNDDFKMTGEEYADETGELDEDGNRMFKNTDSNGRFHSDWCSMIYSRLMLARNLLSEDGVIFISIDDNEQDNLKKICDEVFGVTNFIANCILQRSTNGLGDKKGFARNHEYILCYQMSNSTTFNGLSPDENYVKLFDKSDEYGKYKMDGILMKKGAGSRRIDSPTLFFPLYYSTESGKVSLIQEEDYKERLPIKSDGTEGRWTWGKEKIQKENNRLYASPNGTIYIKDYLTNDRRMKMKSILIDSNYLTDRATNQIKKIFDNKVFDTPKPLKLLHDLIDLSSDKNSIILDFFSGSATTAHAVMQLNAEDGGKRKFIMVQFPEKTDEKSEAFKAGYKNICEIGKERIRRAGKKILTEVREEVADTAMHGENYEVDSVVCKHKDLDIGFRVLKLDSTNMTDVYYSPAEYSQDLLSMLESNIKADRSDLDLLFGCLLEWGLPLSLPYSSEQVDGYTVHNYNDGDLIACFDENIPESVIKEIARKQPLRAVFRDSSFTDSPSKINVGEIFKLIAPDTRVRVI